MKLTFTRAHSKHNRFTENLKYTFPEDFIKCKSIAVLETTSFLRYHSQCSKKLRPVSQDNLHALLPVYSTHTMNEIISTK